MTTDRLNELNHEISELAAERDQAVDDGDRDRVEEIDQELERLREEVARVEMEIEKGAA